MKLLLAALLLAQSPPAPAPAPQAFRLAPGDYRWIPFTVRHVPTEVQCSFRVLEGGPTVHVELLPMEEFRRFSRDRDHKTLAVSPDSTKGDFRRIIGEKGQYAVVVKNRAGAGPVKVTLDIATELEPNADVVAKELNSRQRLVVICVSFLLFFAMVGFSGIKLLRALPRRPF